MVEISLSGSGEGLGRAIARGYSTDARLCGTPLNQAFGTHTRRNAVLPETIETERLLLRPVQLDDVEDVLGYASDEEWARYLGVVPHPYKRSDAVAFVARQVLLDRVVHASWAITLEGSNVGGINIRFGFDHSLGEMGWSLARRLWNRGLMTEASGAVINAAFETYPSLCRIRAMADARNLASHRVMEKLGMKHEGTFAKIGS